MKVVCDQYVSLSIPKYLYRDNITYTGRYEKNASQVIFDWPNFSMELVAPQKEVNLYFRCEGLNLLTFTSEAQVTVEQKRQFEVPPEISAYTIALTPSYAKISIVNTTNRQMTLKITKITDSNDGALCFYGADCQLEKSAQYNTTKKIKMLAVGDELVCGTGARPFKACACRKLQNDSSASFVSLLANTFNIETQTVALKKVGIVRNKNEIEFPNDEQNISTLLKQNAGGNKEQNFKFDSFVADIVLLAVGSNDFWDVGVLSSKTKNVPEPSFKIVSDNAQVPSVENSPPCDEKEVVKSPETAEDEGASKITPETPKEERAVTLNEDTTTKATTNQSKKMELPQESVKPNFPRGVPTKVNVETISETKCCSIVDDFIVDDESELDEVFTQKCEDLLNEIISLYKGAKIGVVIGPVMAREGENGWKTAIESVNRTHKDQVVALDCQLCYDEKDKECWGYSRNPSAIGYKAMYQKLLPQFEKLVN
ncbi:hypothetical protein EIN_084630 [Entamoeba invadens IP1]|uniref:hypothetical protein n=1 Tax=Entamoeba invadens IP1 TaxID=370355 RepID=UPI0002C3FBF3|nr:hypothetical protein EIN_084630 [Entamoeba invadens IP1]ELP85271.1 hypothetical protein EIN_084630 [Entamoeba invadens IP1]|eukprot:XP_004184617.1 hypothetical protein EIN_084630 [Entamoeba invadens IP1]